jgi:hypothetical protein
MTRRMTEHCIESAGAPPMPAPYAAVLYEWDMLKGRAAGTLSPADARSAALERSAEGQTVTLDVESLWPADPVLATMCVVEESLAKRAAMIAAVREVRACDGWYGLPFGLSRWYHFEKDAKARAMAAAAVKAFDASLGVFGRRTHLSLYRLHVTREVWLEVATAATREARALYGLPITAWVCPMETGATGGERVLAREEFASDCRHVLKWLSKADGDGLRVWFPRTLAWDPAWDWHLALPRV